VTLLYLAIVIALPLAAMILKTMSLGWAEFWAWSPRRARSPYA
jgi:sulfate transport system permease protein